MNARRSLSVQMIPIDQITVLNPRARGKKKFGQIAANIASIGLKKPVTVALSMNGSAKTKYLLVCGQGRLEAYQAMGETDIPALIVEGTKEQLLLMSLAENMARRLTSPVELVRNIDALKQRGYSYVEIAAKTYLDVTYVRGIISLLNKGEERLLRAVDKGQIPVSLAIMIARSDDESVQRALADAYERRELRGRALLKARQIVEARRNRGKTTNGGPKSHADRAMTSAQLLKTYQNETARQRATVQRARLCETRLLFTVHAIRQLLRDDNFVNVLRAESLDTLPQFLADQVREGSPT